MHFDSRFWQALRGLDATRPILVESDSKKIGRSQVPDVLIAQRHAAR